MDSRASTGKDGKGAIGRLGAADWVRRGLSCQTSVLTLGWRGCGVVQSQCMVTTCLLLSLPFGPAAPPELSLGTSLSRYLVAAIKPKTEKGVKWEKAPQVGGHPPGSVSEPCSRPSTNSHCCTPTPRLGFLPFIVPAASRTAGQAGLSYLLPAGTALLSLCLLASRLCKAMRGHRVEPQHCWPRPRRRKCRREELWPLALNTP